MPHAYADIAFTPSVREGQKRLGSAGTYARRLSPDHDGGAELGAREAAFLSACDGFFQGTVSETGWPHVQYRGGAPGFLKVIDRMMTGFADHRGSGQYISLANLRHDDRVSILAFDYARHECLKLFGHARITEDPNIVDFLAGFDRPRAERGVVILIAAFEWNCPSHEPVRNKVLERHDEAARLLARIPSPERERDERTAFETDTLA